MVSEFRYSLREQRKQKSSDSLHTKYAPVFHEETFWELRCFKWPDITWNLHTFTLFSHISSSISFLRRQWKLGIALDFYWMHWTIEKYNYHLWFPISEITKIKQNNKAIKHTFIILSILNKFRYFIFLNWISIFIFH